MILSLMIISIILESINFEMIYYRKKIEKFEIIFNID